MNHISYSLLFEALLLFINLHMDIHFKPVHENQKLGGFQESVSHPQQYQHRVPKTHAQYPRRCNSRYR